MVKYFLAICVLISGALLVIGSDEVKAQQLTFIATTTINLSICGDSLVGVNEQCDVPGDTGLYSTNIAGRQCNPSCDFAPYCGDGILQTVFTEECDDANNTSGDFCSELCKIEPPGSGGAGSSGGGGGRGGSTRDLGDTSVSVTGIAYPSQQINFLLDTKSVGSVRANTNGQFEFATKASPGTATLGVWANDATGRRSITLNNTFDVTQGAITNVSGLILPPTVNVANAQVSPGSVVTVSGQAIPNARIEVHLGSNQLVQSGQSDSAGRYTIQVPTSGLRNAEYTLKARSVTGVAPLFTQSGFSSLVQLSVGVDGAPSSPSDLSRDGKINLTDFSIMIFWWQGTGGDSNPPADISGNGRVSLEDFSILLFNWTG